MHRHILTVTLLKIAPLCLLVAIPLLALISLGTQVIASAGLTVPPSSTASTAYTPTPLPSPAPVLTVRGPVPTLNAKAYYLLDMDTGNVLADVNGEEPLPMASTTKIMTALIAIEAGNLNQPVTVGQDAYNEVWLHDGSYAGLRVGETYTLRDLLYGLMVPSGDDAAVAIADAVGGSEQNFVEIMNLYAYRLRLFHTHYADPDGLNWQGSPDHYSSAGDLTRLALYAMHIPLFAQIVRTSSYSVPATAQHMAHTWTTTNTLLTTYPGMLGIKTGYTDAAGRCLVFAAERNGHHLIGTILGSPSETLRDKDVATLLNWGFSLPVLPPTY
jgi:D-alanyl-D-alanine carboxypeptidase (penicillin-binding protein 5/6)